MRPIISDQMELFAEQKAAAWGRRKFDPRKEHAMQMREGGAAYGDIAQLLGVTRERARQLCWFGLAQRKALSPEVCAAKLLEAHDYMLWFAEWNAPRSPSGVPSFADQTAFSVATMRYSSMRT